MSRGVGEGLTACRDSAVEGVPGAPPKDVQQPWERFLPQRPRTPCAQPCLTHHELKQELCSVG